LTPAEPAGVILDFGGALWNMRWDVCQELEATPGLERGRLFSSTPCRTEA